MPCTGVPWSGGWMDKKTQILCVEATFGMGNPHARYEGSLTNIGHGVGEALQCPASCMRPNSLTTALLQRVCISRFPVEPSKVSRPELGWVQVELRSSSNPYRPRCGVLLSLDSDSSRRFPREQLRESQCRKDFGCTSEIQRWCNEDAVNAVVCAAVVACGTKVGYTSGSGDACAGGRRAPGRQSHRLLRRDPNRLSSLESPLGQVQFPFAWILVPIIAVGLLIMYAAHRRLERG